MGALVGGGSVDLCVFFMSVPDLFLRSFYSSVGLAGLIDSGEVLGCIAISGTSHSL